VTYNYILHIYKVILCPLLVSCNKTAGTPRDSPLDGLAVAVGTGTASALYEIFVCVQNYKYDGSATDNLH
jgi:hypothetical protein